MIHIIRRTALALAALLVVASPGLAQPWPGYRVYSWGYYDRYPYPPPVGSSVVYYNAPPTVSYVDPWGRVVDMPLRPKVLWGNEPFLTPGGYYYPVSVTVIPDRARPPVSYKVGSSTPAPAPARVPAPAANGAPPPVAMPPGAFQPIPKARDLDAPVVPEVPNLPALPKLPAVPGTPKLGPAPTDTPDRNPG